MNDQYKNIASWYDKIFEPLNSGLRKIKNEDRSIKELPDSIIFSVKQLAYPLINY